MLKLLATLASLVLIGFALAACDTGIRSCTDLYPAQQCQALAGTAAGLAGIDPSNVVELEVLPKPTLPPNAHYGPPLVVRIHTADNRQWDVSVCSNIPGAAAERSGCNPDPATWQSPSP